MGEVLVVVVAVVVHQVDLAEGDVGDLVDLVEEGEEVLPGVDSAGEIEGEVGRGEALDKAAVGVVEVSQEVAEVININVNAITHVFLRIVTFSLHFRCMYVLVLQEFQGQRSPSLACLLLYYTYS